MKIKKIVVIESAAIKFESTEEETQAYDKVNNTETDTLYVLRMLKGEKDYRLYMTAYASGCDADWVPLLDEGNEDLLKCKAEVHVRGQSEEIGEETFNWYEGWITKEIGGQQKEELLGADEPKEVKDRLLDSELFSENEEKNIKDFWGKDLLTSVKKLDEMLNGKRRNQEQEEEEELQEYEQKDEETEARKKLTALIEELKKTLSLEEVRNRRAANDNLDDVLAYMGKINKAAEGLKESLKLTSRWEKVKKWMYRIIGAIVGVISGAMLGVKVGAFGTGAGGVFGGYAGYKFGNRIGNFFSSVRAKADYADTINEMVKKKMPAAGNEAVKKKM